MSFFKPEDFSHDGMKRFTSTNACELASAKLLKEGVVVYSEKNEKDPTHPVYFGCFKPNPILNRFATHKALLIRIEPINECKHPIEKLQRGLVEYFNDDVRTHIILNCECGARVIPTAYEKIKEK